MKDCKANKYICPVCNLEMSPLTKRVFFRQYVKKIKCGKCFYYKCNKCGHVLLDVPEDINLKYQINYRKNMPMSGDVIDGELSNKYYSNREKILQERTGKIDSLIGAQKSIFEIGCGGGYLLNFYRKKGNIVAGIEVDDLCVNACERLEIDCIKGDFLKAKIKKKYDIVMAWHVLEHVIDINRFMKKMVRITNKNGLVFIEVPTGRKPIEQWSHYDGHIHYFNKKSFKKLADKFNLRCLHLGEGIQKPALLFIGTVQ